MRGKNSFLLLTVLVAGCGSEGRYPGQCAARLSGWKKPSDGYGVLSVTNKVRVLRDGTVRWNGEAITQDKLAEYSAILPTMNPIPFTILEIEDGANCSVVQKVRETINVRAKCMEWGMSRCGEGAEPWALIGDVVGPNGETFKYYPDGRHETIKPTLR